MRILFILTIFLSVLISSTIYGKEKAGSNECAAVFKLIDQKSLNLTDPVFKKAFTDSFKGKYKSAAKKFEQVFFKFDEQIKLLFHGQECRSKVIKTFLAENLYGKYKRLIPSDNGFVYPDEVYLAYTGSLCFLKQTRKSENFIQKALFEKESLKIRLVLIFILLDACRLNEAKKEMGLLDESATTEFKLMEKLEEVRKRCKP